MDELRFYHHGDDGARYNVEIVPDDGVEENPRYAVDFVRAMTGRFGESLEQRLTLAHYDQHDAAQAHCDDVEHALYEGGLQGVEELKDRVTREPVLYDGEYLFVTYPPEAEGTDRSALHLMRVSESGIDSARLAGGEADAMARATAEYERDWAQAQLPDALIAPSRYVIADSGFTRDTEMTIHDGIDQAWVSHLDGGGTSHWFAVVQSQPESEDPFELRYFRAVEQEEGIFKQDSYPVMPLPDADPGSAWPLPALEMYLEKGDVYMAQQLAHDVAEHHGIDFPPPLALPALDPEPEYYFGYSIGPSNAPSLEAVKTWMDGAERRFDTFTIAEYGMYDEAQPDEQELVTLMRRDGLEVAMNQAEHMAVAGGYLDPQREDGRVFFEDDAPPDLFTTVRERALELEPRYSVSAISANGASHLDVVKTWGQDSYASLIIPQPDWDTAADNALTARDMMQNDNLQGAMRLVELAAMEAGVLDPHRDDPRLFSEGPPDPFETLAERLQGEPNPYWNVSDESGLLTAPIQDTDTAAHYWQMHYRPVETPDGAPLGTALFVTEYPQLPPDFDALVEAHGMDDSMYPTQARTLEMAHFASEADAKKFEVEFRSYLIPGLLEGPELAPEVAKLEGLSGEWQDMDYQGIVDIMSGSGTIVREESDWHLHNPHAEREARIEAEGVYSDSIQQFMKLDEDEPRAAPASLDFEL